MKVVKAVSRLAAAFAVRAASHPFPAAAVFLAAAVSATAVPLQAQPSPSPSERRVVVIGEGSVRAAPDYARIRSGVTTRAKTAKEAAEANAKIMAAVTAMLLLADVGQKDIQTSRFSVQPIYESRQPNSEQKLSGFAVSNQVNVTIRQIGRLGEILDRLVMVGATDIGSVEFLHSDTSKVLDQAREAAVADARRKAELYARASGLALGNVTWITEDPEYAPPMPKTSVRAFDGAAGGMAVPIAAGEDTLRVRITVGFDMVH
jgi:uncharacterized protein